MIKKIFGVLLMCAMLLPAVGSARPQGLVVVVGDSTGEELARLCSGEGMLVHGLVDAAAAQAARMALLDKGLVGPLLNSILTLIHEHHPLG